MLEDDSDEQLVFQILNHPLYLTLRATLFLVPSTYRAFFYTALFVICHLHDGYETFHRPRMLTRIDPTRRRVSILSSATSLMARFTPLVRLTTHRLNKLDLCIVRRIKSLRGSLGD